MEPRHLDCGHAPTAGRAIAYDTADRTICYRCAEAAELAAMRANGRTIVYDTGAEYLTTWTGAPMLRVTSRARRRHNIARSMTYVTARDADGSNWYGHRSTDRCECVTMRRAAR